jgi:GMP synthase (glutamine-hydrolysing)
MQTFARNLGVKVIHVDAAEQFMGHLKGRRRSGAEAQDHRPRVCRGLPGRGGKAEQRQWLAQGTIYPDVIESAGSKTGKAHTIKSHHNVGGLPETAESQAARTAARTVQGRSARTRHRARPAA